MEVCFDCCPVRKKGYMHGCKTRGSGRSLGLSGQTI
jgi:hypothetical protein